MESIMNINHQIITGIFLAGGMSKRMGLDKGKITIANRPLYKFGLEVLEQVCEKIIISTQDESNHFGNHEIVSDAIPGLGPIGGIFTCLKKSLTELNFVLSYDLPLVSKELLIFLLNESGDYDIVVPCLQLDRLEPLCGIYRKSVTEKLDWAIQNKNYAVHSIFELVKFKTVQITREMPFYSPHLFLNINSPEDLEILKSILRKE
jgi:molybdopterin-guanine dinucleotide biosynthesis protein A